MRKGIILLFFICLNELVNGTIHYLSLRVSSIFMLFFIYGTCYFQGETRRNIALTKFGYDDMGTLQFNLSNFTVPDEVVSFKESQENRDTDKFVSHSNRWNSICT